MSLEVTLRHAHPGFTLDARFTAADGLTVLYGRSGAGKSSIAHAVAGLLRPDEGRIVLDGRVLFDSAARRHVPPHRRRIGMVFQDARLFPHLSVRQNLDYGRWMSRGRGGRNRSRIIEMLGIGHLLDRRPATLSGGERQRVAIGRALIAAPDALVMDEPLAALDEARKAGILPYIERLRDETALPILYVSHALAEVSRLATTLVLIDEGRVAAAGAAAALLSDPTLFPAFGRHEAGVLIEGRIAGYDPAEALTRVRVAAGELRVPGEIGAAGDAVRLRIRARDVMLATEPPVGLSALNVLPVRVEAVGDDTGPIVDIRLACGGDAILARITRSSVARLGVVPGREMFAVLKSISFGRRDVIG